MHELFGQVLIPPAVFDELQDEEKPQAVRTWVAEIPSWLKVIPIDLRSDPALDFLDEGEREAIALAEQVQADRILLDEAAARREATRRNLVIIGTLGVLREAARRNLIDLPKTIDRLQTTTFFVKPELIRLLLDEASANDRSDGHRTDPAIPRKYPTATRISRIRSS